MNDELQGKDSRMAESVEISGQTAQEDITKIIQWVNEIKLESSREKALAELSKIRDYVADMAIFIWYSPGTVTAL
jgi:hypothetical protein